MNTTSIAVPEPGNVQLDDGLDITEKQMNTTSIEVPEPGNLQLDDGLDIGLVEAIADEDAPLYKHYSGQFDAQDAYVQLDEDGHVSASYNASIGGTPVHVYHRRTLRFEVPNNLSGAALLALVQKHRPILARIYYGHDVEWDGSNHVGVLDGDALDAVDELEYALQDVEGDVEVAMAYECFLECDLRDCWRAGKSLEDAVEEIMLSAERNARVIIGDIEDALLEFAELTFQDHPDAMNKNHVDELLEQGRITVEAAEDWIEEFGESD